MEERMIKESEVIDLRVVARKIRDNRRLYYKVLPVVCAIACVYILGVPRYYTSEVKLAPELDNASSGGALSSIAASFGFDIGNMQSTDAISPVLYPDLMEDNGFVCSLFDIKVRSKEGDINTTYFDYLKKHQQRTIWFVPFRWVFKSVKKLFKKEEKRSGEFSPYHLSKDEDEIAELIRDRITFSLDKKSGVITIDTQAQDALICTTLADSVQERLKDFIIEYRTNKARTDYNYYLKLAKNAKHEYEKTRQIYSSMSDANSKVSLRSVELKIEDVENDMQLKFNTYTTLNAQMEAAKAKVQEHTPVFTVLKGAAEPVKPAGPKRMLFVLAMLIVAFFGTTAYLFLEDFKKAVSKH